MRGGFDGTEDELSLFQDVRNREKQRNNGTFLMQSFFVQPGNGEPKAMSNISVDDDMLSSDSDRKNDYDWLLTPPETPILSMDLDLFNNGCSLDAPKHVCPPKLSHSQAAHHNMVDVSISSRAKSPFKPSMKMDKRHSSPGPVSNLKPLSSSSANAHHYDAKANDRSLLPSAKPNSSSNVNAQCYEAKSNGRSSWPNVKLNTSVNHAHHHDSPTLNKRSESQLAQSRASFRQAPPPLRQSTPLRGRTSPDTLVRSSSANEATSSSRCTVFTSSTSPLKPMGSRRSLSNSRGASVGFPNHQSEPSSTIPHYRFLSRSSAQDVHVGNKSMKPRNVLGHSSSPTISDRRTQGMKPNGKMSDRTPPPPSGLGSKIREKISQNLKRVKPLPSQGEAFIGMGIKKALKPTLRNNKATSNAACFEGNQALEVVLRRMDTCKSPSPSGLRAFMSNISMSSLHSIRCGKKGAVPTNSVVDSPMATSSTASSDQSRSTIIDPEGSIDESLSERESRASVASRNDLSSPNFSMYSKESHITNWLGEHDYGEEDVDIMQIFEQRLGGLSGSGAESPLINEVDGTIELDNFCLDSMPW